MQLSRKAIILATASLFVSACQPVNRNNMYTADEAGHDAVILYGTIKSFRQVDIKGNNTGAGALVGATAGGLAGSTIGSGNGSIAATIAGVVIGGVAGAAAEQSMANQQGLEYIINFPETGETRSIVQTIAKDQAAIPVGQCVMVQMGGNYQRVLPEEDASNCPKPSKRKIKHTKTKLKSGDSETTIERQ